VFTKTSAMIMILANKSPNFSFVKRKTTIKKSKKVSETQKIFFHFGTSGFNIQP